MCAIVPVEKCSRRKFFGYSGASLALASGGALAQSIAPSPPGQKTDPSAQRIATENDAAKHLTVSVTIGGKGPFRFVVDTGADRSVIADDVAAYLGLIRGPTVTVQGVVKSLLSQTVTVHDLNFGAGRRFDLMMPVLPRVLLQADGYLGLDAIDGYRVLFDFHHNALVITEPRHVIIPGLIPPSQVKVQLRGSQGHLRSMNCRVDGVPTTTFIDTGAEISVGNTKLLEALLDRDPAYFIIGTLPITGVTGGQMNGQLTEVRNVRLNPLTFSGCVLLIADLQIFALWDLLNDPALLIGMNFLRQFQQVSIDYGRKELMFDLASTRIAQRA
ncbi:MAG: retroviral-like aspartic protease family protein [Alphaproteobacteria bacterium]|nr:retroviral-like aspartic protease family protein [Alphaproteobacteria bacterium]